MFMWGMYKMEKLKEKRAVRKWREIHGACDFDFKNKEINLIDGVILSIGSKNVKRHKIIGHKELSNGALEVLFSKNKLVKDKDYYANIWFEDVDGIIKYFKDIKKMLNSLGYKTSLYKK